MADVPVVLESLALTKLYPSGDETIRAVDGVDIRVSSGSFSVVMGRSGSGKTTLLNLLGGLDQPTSGHVHLNGALLSEMDETERASVRRNEIGFIFQAFGLLPMLTAAENIEVPLRLVKADPDERRARSRELLDLVGLTARATHRPDELSGGEQQRVAIARALANKPRLLLADEPTGQLDSRTGGEIVRVLAELVETSGIAAFIATHDSAPLAHADQVLRLSDGKVSVAADY
jgi:putative ABC transport system ATP-binding protein